MPPSDASLHDRGDPLDAISTGEEDPKEDSSYSGQILEGTEPDISAEDHWTSLARLIRESYRIDQHLNEILERVYDCQPPFYSAAGKRRLQRLLDELHDARQQIRELEQDAEELALSISKSDQIDTQVTNTIDPAVAGVKRTYDRAYDLCLYKLDSMNDGWITATNLLISIVMIVLTLLFWMEFWE